MHVISGARRRTQGAHTALGKRAARGICARIHGARDRDWCDGTPRRALWSSALVVRGPNKLLLANAWWLADALRAQEILFSRHSQYCAIANFQGNFRNLKFSHPRRFPAEFLEMYSRGNLERGSATLTCPEAHDWPHGLGMALRSGANWHDVY